MAETTKFELEGDVVLAYSSENCALKQVLIQEPTVSGRPAVASEGPEGLEEYIARQLGFPTDEEFEVMIQRLDQLRNEGLRPAEGKPDIVRKGVKLRISVEVLN